MAWEAHVALFWLVWVLWLLLKPLSVKRGWLIAVGYTAAILTYNTPLLLAPVLMIFIWLQKKQSVKERLIKSGIIGILAAMMLVVIWPLMQQKQAITIFNDPTIAAKQREAFVTADSWWEKLKYQRYVNWALIAVDNEWKSLGSKFLVFDGGANPWQSIPSRGHIMLSVYAAAVMGGWYWFTTKNKLGMKWRWPWLVLFVLSLLPAIVTVDAPHATRSLLFFWLLGLVASMAVKMNRYMLPLLTVGLGIELMIFLGGYFSWFPQNMPQLWLPGLKEAINQAEMIRSDQLVVITNDERSQVDIAAEQPYIYALWYTKTLPSDYQATVQYLPPDSAGIYRVRSFGHYLFVDEFELKDDAAIMILRQEDGSYELKD
jgi:hypothetical protein